MKIDAAAFTPMNIQNNPQVQKANPVAFENAIASTSRSQSVGQPSQATPIQAETTISASQTENTSGMSKYLNTEEKQMLNMLFPPVGRQTGVQAYRAVQMPVRNPAVLGKNLDITS